MSKAGMVSGRHYTTESGEVIGPMSVSTRSFNMLTGHVENVFINGGNPGDNRSWMRDGSCNVEGSSVLDFGEDTKATKRAEILAAATEYATKDRQATHGKPEDTFGLIAAYWSAHLDTSISAHDVAAMMALLKLARSKQNPQNMDNWIDACGYAACAGELVG